MIDPIIKEIVVPADPDKAFKVFTKDIFSWWPMDSHSLSASQGELPKSVVVTPKVGGAIIEELFDGSKANWGVITEWKPGNKLSFTWHLRRPESEQTHVSVEFSASDSGTLVRLVHSNWQALGKDGPSNREQYNSGWDYVLGECFAGAVR